MVTLSDSQRSALLQARKELIKRLRVLKLKEKLFGDLHAPRPSRGIPEVALGVVSEIIDLDGPMTEDLRREFTFSPDSPNDIRKFLTDCFYHKGEARGVDDFLYFFESRLEGGAWILFLDLLLKHLDHFEQLLAVVTTMRQLSPDAFRSWVSTHRTERAMLLLAMSLEELATGYTPDAIGKITRTLLSRDKDDTKHWLNLSQVQASLKVLSDLNESLAAHGKKHMAPLRH